MKLFRCGAEAHSAPGAGFIRQLHEMYPAACGKSRHRASPTPWVAIFRMMMVMAMMVMVMTMTIAMETTAMTMRARRRRKRMASHVAFFFLHC